MTCFRLLFSFLLMYCMSFAQQEDSTDIEIDSLLQRLNRDTTQIEIKGDIHFPDEIMKIMGQSELYYILMDLPDTSIVREASEKTVLSNQLYIKKEDGKSEIHEYELSKKANKISKLAEDLFDKKDYAASLSKYMKLYNTDTTYYHALTLIGDCFYNLGDYENAIFYFNKAIDKNFIDYDAHWFKADALRHLGRTDEALREITIAHLLNVNHENLNMVIRRYREIIGRPWKEMDFEPLYHLEKTGDSVFVKAAPGWLGYAIVKAVWKYEPGYAQQMIGEDYRDEFILSSLAEKEAAISMMVEKNMEEMFESLLKEGMLDEFIMYEFLIKKYPLAILSMTNVDRGFFNGIIDYIDRYH